MIKEMQKMMVMCQFNRIIMTKKEEKNQLQEVEEEDSD